ncbi:hypothetical protein E6Q11_03025 [Candidatus Dojkabacteria bacterium]|uniref:Uncharacterized protein n=1 Tax=Candidatus Dojkabacteria bacterium TaxID=2099670 RepID=A0A5C7J6P8_9BACT|nr:MAG: hypothetical protein E6Q11_03025 [Candidatus Dojkabacteria bacterium]
MSKRIVAIFVAARKYIGGNYGYAQTSSQTTVLYDDRSESEHVVKASYGSAWLEDAFKVLAKDLVLNIPQGQTRYDYLNTMGINLISDCCQVGRVKDLHR